MKRRKTKSKSHRYQAMNADELAEATAVYGREMAIDAFRPLTKAERAHWDRARRNPGRPRRGKGVKVISVSVEQDLLLASDRLASRLGLSRARLIERGLRMMIEEAGK